MDLLECHTPGKHVRESLQKNVLPKGTCNLAKNEGYPTLRRRIVYLQFQGTKVSETVIYY